MPTAATDSVLITEAIYATEDRAVAVIDAPGAFLTADTDEEVIIVLEKKNGQRDVIVYMIVMKNKSSE